MKNKKFNNLIFIKKTEFFSNNKINYIRNLVLKGNILVLKSAFKKNKLRNIFKKIYKSSVIQLLIIIGIFSHGIRISMD